MELQIVPMCEVVEWMEGLLRQSHISSIKLISLLGGDRASCCDEAAVIKDCSQIVAVSSIAPFGEGRNPGLEKMAREPGRKRMGKRLGLGKPGEPTIVGVFVLPEYRRKGMGYQVLEAAIRRCIERSLVPIRIDSMSAGIMRAIDRLPEELHQHLQVNDQGDVMDMMPG